MVKTMACDITQLVQHAGRNRVISQLLKPLFAELLGSVGIQSKKRVQYGIEARIVRITGLLFAGGT